MSDTPQQELQAPESERQWWTNDEVGERYRTTIGTVRFWDATGKIKGAKVGRRKLYPLSEIHRLDAELLADIAAVQS